MRRRVQRINDLLRQELSDLLRQAKDPRLAAIVSITEVRTSADLRHARIFVSIYGPPEAKASAFQGLQAATKFLRYELAGRLGLRRMPELAFSLDDSIERGARIHALLQPETASQTPEQESV